MLGVRVRVRVRVDIRVRVSDRLPVFAVVPLKLHMSWKLYLRSLKLVKIDCNLYLHIQISQTPLQGRRGEQPPPSQEETVANQLFVTPLFAVVPHELGTLYHNRFRTRLLFLSSDGNWRLCCSSRPFRLTNNMSHAVYQQRTVTCLATLTESDCTVVLQQKCDNATLIIFISTTTTTTLIFVMQYT